MPSLPTVLSMLALAATAAAQSATPAGWTTLARTEIHATVVVRGELVLEDPDLLERAERNGGAYVEFEVRVRQTLKGPHRPSIRLLFFAAPRVHPHGYSPHADDMRRLLGRDCILLLQSVGSRFFLADRFESAAIFEDSPATLARVAEIIGRHDRMAHLVPSDDVPLAAEVDRILDGMAAEPAAEVAGFARLQELGPVAVPALVRHLDDDRPVRSEELAIARRPGSPGEPMVRIHPAHFGDALFVVLQQIAGQSFGYECGVSDPRRRAVAHRGWRIYAQYVLEGFAEAPLSRAK